MKPLSQGVLTAGLAAVLTIGLLGCEAGTTNTASNTNTANASANQSVTFFVEGMVWGTSWTTAVEEQLNELPGVADVSTDMDAQTATVTFDPAKFKPADAVSIEEGRFKYSVHEE